MSSHNNQKHFLFLGTAMFAIHSIHRIQQVEGGFAVYQVEPDGTIEKHIVKSEYTMVQLYQSIRFD
jgi:hypothetical protein